MSAVPIPTYLSHSYRAEDRRLNEFFWELFWEHGFAFTVDPKSGPLSLPQLELTMRRSACFVSVVTRRADQPRYRSSPFAIYEYGLAVQAQKPRLVFTETGVPARFFPESAERRVFDRDRLNPAAFAQDLTALADRSRGYGTLGDRLLGEVGLLLPDDPAYEECLPDVHAMLEGAGYQPRTVSLDFQDPVELALETDRYDFVLVDVADEALPGWVYPFLHGRFVPSIKLIRCAGGAPPGRLPPLAASAALSLASPLREQALWWHTPRELLEQLEWHIDRIHVSRRQFVSLEEGLRYFRSVDRPPQPVFLSNAQADDDLARDLARAFDLHNIEFFHYLYRNTIEVGTEWADRLLPKVEASQVFVALLSEAYWRSEWCRQEFELAERLRQQGRLTIIPYFLDNASGTAVSVQGVSLWHCGREEQARRIVEDVDARLESAPPGPAPAQAMTEVLVEVASAELFEAVTRHLQGVRRDEEQGLATGHLTSGDRSLAPTQVSVSRTAGAFAGVPSLLLTTVAGPGGPGDVIVSGNDPRMVSLALTLDHVDTGWTRRIREKAPRPAHRPQVVEGAAARPGYACVLQGTCPGPGYREEQRWTTYSVETVAAFAVEMIRRAWPHPSWSR